MPKNKPPKYARIGKYAAVYLDGKPNYLGLYNSPESKAAYARFEAEWWTKAQFTVEKRNTLTFQSSQEQRGTNATIHELAAAFLDHAKANVDPTTYSVFQTIVLDFLTKLYGNDTLVEDFKPSCLKLVRSEMIRSRRFCRNTLNRHIHRIVSVFAWGVEEELVPETTWRALKAVKSLPKGYPETFDHKEREDVPFDGIKQTLQFMPPTLRAMVQIQFLLGLRPSEVFNMRVGDLDVSRKNGLWYYMPGAYKTERFVGKMQFPMGKPAQVLIAPYLEGKSPDQAVFSPHTAMEERKAMKKSKGKTKPTPSRVARDKARAGKPKQYNEFYNRHSYNRAVAYAIQQANRNLPDEKKVEHWTPYRLRNSAATHIEIENGLDEAQAQLGHKTANMTRRYSKAQLRIREGLAREQINPFDTEEVEELK